jgi:GGDEF domain-containing protein
MDQFKAVNDLAGHEAGDEVLRGAGNRLTEFIQSGDMVSRIGGDEFIVLLESFSERQVVVNIAERILAVMSEPFLFPFDGSDAETLLKKADSAMYEVKNNGGNGWRFYTPFSGS